MKSINPDPLTPDQAIDILHRVAAAEGAPIFKDCADLIVRLHMDNFLLTKHRDEFDRLHDEARAQCDSLRTQNEKLREALQLVADEHGRCMREVSEIGYSDFNYTAGMACAVSKALAATEVKS